VACFLSAAPEFGPARLCSMDTLEGSPQVRLRDCGGCWPKLMRNDIVPLATKVRTIESVGGEDVRMRVCLG
jgi:hypothetical protein